MEESTIRQRLGGRRDSAAQISAASPPSTSPPPNQRRRRSSLAQLTDILREWSGGGSKRQKAPLNRRETLADLARSLPWSRNTDNSSNQTHLSQRKRRESSADSGIKSMRSRRESHTSDFNKMWSKKESSCDKDRDKENTDTGASTSDGTRNGSRRGSGESFRSGRRDSTITRAITPPPPKVVGATKKRRDSLTVMELPNFRQEQRPSTSSTASDSGPYFVTMDTGCQSGGGLPPPTIVTSSVTPPATSPTAPPSGRRDSTTQCGRINRRDSRASPERPRLQRLQRQATAFDESCPPLGCRRESQPALSPTGCPDSEESERRARRDSLSPDSASRGRRDSRQHLSPDRSHDRDGSPRRRSKVRRQSSSAGRNPRSPDSSSCCSSR